MINIEEICKRILSGRRIVLHTSLAGTVPGGRKNVLKYYIDPINYCYENKEIAGEGHTIACHLSVMNLTSICERFETFARTTNKHPAFKGN